MSKKNGTYTKLYLLMIIIAASLSALGFYGINELKKMNANIEMLYSNRMLCTQQLATIRLEYLTEIIPVNQAVKNHTISQGEATQRIRKAQKIINTTWREYKHTYLTNEEKILVNQVDVMKRQTDETDENLKSAFSKANSGDTYSFVLLVEKIGQLLDLQARVGKEILNNNKELYQDTVKRFALIILISLIVALSLSYYIINNVKNLIAANRKTDSRFRAIVENIFAGIALTDIAGNNIYCSARMRAVKGRTEEEVDQHNLKYIHPEDAPFVTGAYQEAMANPGKYENVIYRFLHKNGNYIWLESLVGNSLSDPDLGAIVTITRDITMRKIAEEQLKKSEEKYRSLIENASDAIYILDYEGKFADANKSMCLMSGYSKEELLQLKLNDLIEPERLKAEGFNFEEINAGKRLRRERRLIRKDGGVFNIEINIKMFTDNRVLVIARDITDRKKADETIRLSELKYKALFENSPVPLWMISRNNFSIITVNKTAADLVGYQKNELLNISIKKLLPEDDLDLHYERSQTPVTGPTDRGVNKCIKKDGTVFFVNTIVNDIFYEGRPVRLVLTQDVTEKLKAEELLKKSEANLQTMMNMTDTAYGLLDNELNIKAFNQMAFKFVRNQFHRVLVEGSNFKEYFPVDRISQFTNRTSEISKGHAISYETSYPQPDGSIFWYSVRLFPVKNNENEILGFMLALSDITERKNSEENLKTAYLQIQDHITSIQDLAWKQSHVIRRPLANLKGLISLLKDDQSDDNVLDFIQHELDEMDKIIIEMEEHASRQGGVDVKISPGVGQA